MRELKAGLGLVFGNLTGWLYFLLILAAWIPLMILASHKNVRAIIADNHVWWFLLFYSFPVWIGMSQLGKAYMSVLDCGGLFCVPRLTKSMKLFAIISGFTLVLMCALPLFLAEWPQHWQKYVAVAIWFTLLSSTFLGFIPGPTISKKPVPLMILILWLAIVLRLMFTPYLGIHPLNGWPAILTAGIFLCVILCGPYTDKRFKSAQRELAGSITDVNERPKQTKSLIAPAVEKFFVNRLTQCSLKHKYLWGTIYLYLGDELSNWRHAWLIVPIFSALVCFIYVSAPLIIGMIVFFIFLPVLNSNQKLTLPVHSQMLVAGGRRERYYGTIAVVIGLSINSGLMLALIAGLSQLIALFIPTLLFRGHTVTLTPMTLYPAYIMAGIIPAYFSLVLCYEIAPFLTGSVVILLAILSIGLMRIIIPAAFSLVPITLFVISCWVFLILTAWIICYKKDLILQTDKI
jgi:hypothetical protein